MSSQFPAHINRRRFLKSLGAAAASSAAPSAFASFPAPGSVAVFPATFTLLPLGSIRPRGWLKDQLRIQADGLSGHLDETWPDVGSNSGWLGGTGESGERGPYFVDGLVPLAYLLDDDRLKAKAQKFMEWALRSQHASGAFGPASNDDWWPRMPMLKALAQYQEVTGDARVMPMMQRYFAYQLSALPTRPLKAYSRFRWQEQVLTVLWLYDRAPDPSLLALAHLLRAQGYDWQAQYAHFRYTEPTTAARIAALSVTPGFEEVRMATHGVNNSQAIKTGALWSRVTGSEADRQSVLDMIAELDRYHGLPNGMFSCDEHLAGRSPSQGSELCSVVEYMYSLEQALAILGEASLGDRLEKLAFNALPGTFTDDMWAHQYDQQPNQVECSLHREPWMTNGPESNLYGLEPHFGCCTANFSQGWPKFAATLFMQSADGGVVAAAYSPCEARISLQGTEIHVVEETDYPFRDTVRLAINPSRPLRFPLLLRIPGWAAGTVITVNGSRHEAGTPGRFARIEREWRRGDIVELVFPMRPRILTGFNNSVSVERGPLVFSYNISQDWLKLRDRGMTADWQVYPGSRWSYALKVDSAKEAQDISVSESPLSDRPFTAAQAPVSLHMDAKLLPSWMAVNGNAETLPESPVSSGEPDETITLVPYAAAKLRVTSFPSFKDSQ
ncbi:beta-L-arabinofuranosidase domain-containing protein [Silvibacterium acidisoli]|uniref:beta-L-arabinofuranosidase domain-containing protein n=1 Tax=Acidobacteriaceae bacterium ZG23-2 TaxID=2883246 RepID=UPI00406CEE6F